MNIALKNELALRSVISDLALPVVDGLATISLLSLPGVFISELAGEDVSLKGRTEMGTGLTIVKRMIEAHYGSIWVESEPEHWKHVLLLYPLLQRTMKKNRNI